MFCPKCGTKSIDGSKFCSKCGTKLIVDTNTKKEGVQEKQNLSNTEKIETGNANQADMIKNDRQQNVDSKNKKNGKTKISGPKHSGIIGRLLSCIAAFALPVCGVITVLRMFPIIGIIILIGAIICVVLRFRHEPGKLILGMGGIVAVAAIVVVFVSISDRRFGNRNDEYIQIVKGGAFDQYPQKTVGEAFDSYLNNAVWESGVSDDDQKFVNVKGGITYFGNDAEILVQFLVDKDDQTFTYNACEIDGVPQNNLVVSELFNTVYSDRAVTTIDSESDLDFENRITIGETQSYNNEFGNIQVTLDYVEFCDKIENTLTGLYTYPDEECVFLYAGITVKNIGTEEGSLVTAWNTLTYDGMYEFNHYSTEGDIVGIAPLTSPVTGALVFMVPNNVAESDKPLVLNINDGGGNAIISYNIR